MEAKSPQDEAQGRPEGLKEPQGGPKMKPRGAQEAPRTPQRDLKGSPRKRARERKMRKDEIIGNK